MGPFKGPHLVVVHTFLRALPLARLAVLATRACASDGLTRGVNGLSGPGAKVGAIVNHVAQRRREPAQCASLHEVQYPKCRGRPSIAAVSFLLRGSAIGWWMAPVPRFRVCVWVVDTVVYRVACDKHKGQRLSIN